MDDISITGLGEAYLNALYNITEAYNHSSIGDSKGYPVVQGIEARTALLDKWLKIEMENSIFGEDEGFTGAFGSVKADTTSTLIIRAPIVPNRPLDGRTLSADYGMEGKNIKGTEGNDGIENTEVGTNMQTSGVDVILHHVSDRAQPVQKLAASLSNLPLLDIVARQIPDGVAKVQNFTKIGEHILGGGKHILKTKRVVEVDPSVSTEGYWVSAINDLVYTINNPDDDYVTLTDYSPEKTVIVLRASVGEKLKRDKAFSPYIQGYNEFIARGRQVDINGVPFLQGKFNFAIFGGVKVKVVSDFYFDNACKCIGMTDTNAAQYANILGYIACGEGNAFATCQSDINFVPLPNNAIGTNIQHCHRWGVRNVRPTANTLLVAKGFTNPITESTMTVMPSVWGEKYGAKTSFKLEKKA